MELLIDAIRTITRHSRSQSRLALLVVAEELGATLDERDALALAATLPLELALVVGRDRRGDAFDDACDAQGNLDALTIAAVCSVLAWEAPGHLRVRLLTDLPSRLAHRLAGPRDSSTWDLNEATRPTVRVDRRASTRPTIRVRAC